MFLETFRYVQFSMDDKILLCIFNNTDKCFRTYSYKIVALN